MQTITQADLKEKILMDIQRGGGIMDLHKRIKHMLEAYTVVENNERCKLCGDLVYGIIQIHHHN